MSEDPKIDRDLAERILGRAASLAVRRADGDVSLAELEAAAEEAGLERALVRRAAAELEVGLVQPQRRFGMETLVARRRLLPRALSRAEIERLLARLDTHFGALGERIVGDGTASWSARQILVSIEPHEGGTLLQISERFVDTAVVTASFAMFMSGFISFVVGVVVVKKLALGLVGAAFIAPVIALSAFIALVVVRRRHADGLRHTAGEFERALDSLERTALALHAPARPDGAPEER